MFTNLTSISRTRCVSGNRSHTLLFIFSLMMNEWQVRQSPIFMALLAATTCSLMLSGGPRGQMEDCSYPLCFMDLTSWCKELWGGMSHTQQRLSLSHPELVMELLADHSAAGVKLMRSHVGDFQQHGWHQIHTLQQLQVDVHVEWHLQKVSEMSWWIQINKLTSGLFFLKKNSIFFNNGHYVNLI